MSGPDFHERSGDGCPGIRDHQVDRAVQGDRLLNGGLHSCKVGHVSYSPAMGIPLRDGLLEHNLISPGDSNARASLDQRRRDSATNATAAAGNESVPPFKSSSTHCILKQEISCQPLYFVDEGSA